MIVAICIVGYLFVGGVVGNAFYAGRKRRCDKCRKGRDCSADHDWSAGFFGAAWIVTIPVLFGALTSNCLNGREGRAEHKEKRRQAEHDRTMKAIDAQNKLIAAQRVAAMESVKFLVDNGIQADVPGLFEAGRFEGP